MGRIVFKMCLAEIGKGVGWIHVAQVEGGGPVAGSDEHRNETSCSLNCWRVLECPSNSRFMKKDAVRRNI